MNQIQQINAFEIDEQEKGIVILQHQFDEANEKSYGKCELELLLFLPYPTIEKLIELKDFKSYRSFRSWVEQVVTRYKSIHPLRDFVAKHKLNYHMNLN